MDEQAAYDLMKAHIRQIEPMSDEDFNELASLFTYETCKKKTYFTRQNEVCRKFAFVVSGCYRTYSIDNKGEEYTVYFAFSEWWIGDKTSFYSNTPARFDTQALEDSVLLVCNQGNWEKALKEIHSFETWYGKKNT